MYFDNFLDLEHLPTRGPDHELDKEERSNNYRILLRLILNLKGTGTRACAFVPSVHRISRLGNLDRYIRLISQQKDNQDLSKLGIYVTLLGGWFSYAPRLSTRLIALFHCVDSF